MIRELTRRSGAVWQVVYRPTPAERLSRVFYDPTEAEAFDQIASARWPIEPLIVRCGYKPDSPEDLSKWAEAYGLDTDTLGTARTHGLTDVQADQYATAAGLHPVDVWGWAWCEVALAPPDPEPFGAVA